MPSRTSPASGANLTLGTRRFAGQTAGIGPKADFTEAALAVTPDIQDWCQSAGGATGDSA